MDDYALYGYSLFETILVRNGRYRLLDYHWYRLSEAAEKLNLAAPDWEHLLDLFTSIPSTGTYAARVSLLKMGGRWSLAKEQTRLEINFRPVEEQKAPAQHLVLSALQLPCHDPLRCFKSGNRLIYQKQHQAAQKTGYDGVLFQDQKGRLLETSLDNVYLNIDGSWITPPIRLGLLPGTVRGYLLDQKICKEETITTEQIAEAQSMSISNATKGMISVASIDGLEGGKVIFPPNNHVTDITKRIEESSEKNLSDWRKHMPPKAFRPWSTPELEVY